MSSPMNVTLATGMLCYNEEKWIAKAIECVLAQSRQPDDFLIIDDCSTDDSPRIISEYARRHPFIRCIRNTSNQGALGSLRIAIENLNSDFIHLAAADDMIMPALYEKSLRLLNVHPHVGACSSVSVQIDELDRCQGLEHIPLVSKTSTYIPPRRAAKLLLKYGNWHSGCSTIWRRDVIPIEILGNKDFGPYVDSIAFLNVVLKYGACYIPEVLTRWRMIGEGYFTNVLGNHESYMRISRNVLRSFEHEMKDIVPAGYADHWRDLNDYTHEHYLLSMQKGSQRKITGKVPLLPRLKLALRYRMFRPSFLRLKLSWWLANRRFGRAASLPSPPPPTSSPPLS